MNIEPLDKSLEPNKPGQQPDPAVAMIRNKVASLYSSEPSLDDEVEEVEKLGAHSKHQEFMLRLSLSGKSFADMQVAWHDYYKQLPDNEKHEVWQEFYANQSRSSQFFTAPSHKPLAVNGGEETESVSGKPSKPNTKKPKKPIVHSVKAAKPESIAELKHKISAKVSADGKLTKKHHLKSILFGLSLSAVMALLVAFTLFNQIFLAPFITPSKTASASPLIADSSTAIGPETKLIIPKLNLEAPIMDDLPDNQEKTIQKFLENGVTLYPNTGKPGELANPTIFGHSSNNIFNGGDYKFIFVRLNQLENGDTFYINYNGKQYVYKVFDKKIVKPNQVDVLTERPKPAMATLITCDPPGTSTNRLIVHAEQISPDPGANIASNADQESDEPTVIPGNAESLFQRLLNWL